MPTSRPFELPPCVAPPADMVGWWPGDGIPVDIQGTNPGVHVGTVGYAAGVVAFSLDLAERGLVFDPQDGGGALEEGVLLEVAVRPDRRAAAWKLLRFARDPASSSATSWAGRCPAARSTPAAASKNRGKGRSPRCEPSTP